MDVEDFPPPPPERKVNTFAFCFFHSLVLCARLLIVPPYLLRSAFLVKFKGFNTYLWSRIKGGFG